MSVFNVVQHTIQASHIRGHARATRSSQNHPLLLHIKQYVPKNCAGDGEDGRDGGVTVIGAHANGLLKELYEPLWEDLYAECQSKGVRVRSIWVMDCAWQGTSGVLNAEHLGDDPTWSDYARDIVHMINTFRPPRPLLAVGHSFGATALVMAAQHHPRLFASMVLIEPVIFSGTPERRGPARASMDRRDVWPSLVAAQASFAKNPFFASWDPRVLRAWMAHGVMPREDGTVALTTSKHQEVFTFVSPVWNARRPFYRTEEEDVFERLPRLRAPVLFFFGGGSDVLPSEAAQEIVRHTVGRVKAITVQDAGHLAALEKPGFIAHQAVEWVKHELEVWQKGEREWEEWRGEGGEVVIGEELRRRLREEPGKAKL